MTLEQRFAALLPDAFFLDPSNPEALNAYLKDRHWIEPERRVSGLSRAGEGNMNLVLRVMQDDGSRFILKQSRPWAEKYPSVEAPAARANVEAEYYRRTASEPTLALYSPQLYQADFASHILMMEDLGAGADLSCLYQAGTRLDEVTLKTLVEYLVALHSRFRHPDCGFVIENHEMRALNAAHIFRLPFADDTNLDLDAITPGLAAVATRCREDAALLAEIETLCRRYLTTGNTLVHGDFFPGSLLRTDHGIRVIDPEFCFFGDAEFDLGVLLAHLTLAGQAPELIEQGLSHYLELINGAVAFSTSLCWQYAGIEVLRRLLGLAQLPLVRDLDTKRALVETATRWLLQA